MQFAEDGAGFLILESVLTGSWTRIPVHAGRPRDDQRDHTREWSLLQASCVGAHSVRSAHHRLSLFLASHWHAKAFHNGHLIPELVGTQPEMFMIR
jgi:hypothetical protein